MTVSAWELALYAGAVFVLFLTPGPVWVAIAARALSGGVRQAWPLALGVALGDLVWPLLAILGVSWIVSVWGGFLTALKWLAAGLFVIMGGLLIGHAGRPVPTDGRLTRPGMWAGFAAGVAVILGNPKAVLFYMGMLPGFFDLRTVGRGDIAAICAVSMVVPLVGNLGLAVVVDRGRRRLTSRAALTTVNRVAGGLLIAVGVLIPLT